MTNFAFIMDLLKISSKKFSEIGFDKSLVSRWRRGKLRLMPNRHIVKSISELFWTVDAGRPHPILQEALNIWYPAEPCGTERERLALLERFLTEKGQLDAEYESRREQRLGLLAAARDGEPFAASKGLEAAELRLLDFLDLVAALPAPVRMEAAYPQGRGALCFHPDFDARLLDKYDALFEKGHTLASVIRTDDAIGAFAHSYHRRLVQLLSGSARNQYFDDFSTDAAGLFLATAGDSLAVELTEEEPGRIDSAISMIYTDAEHVAKIRERIRGYASRSKKREYFGFFDEPAGYLKYVHISPDSPCYLFTRLPHFGVLPPEEFAQSFHLTETESELAAQEIKPLTLGPSYYWEYAAVRHIFCEGAIEAELLKQRHQSPELSRLLKRRVWMNTPHLVRQLREIKNLLNTQKNYEVCFLSEERFDELKVQLALWGYGASIVWTDDAHSAASRGYSNQRVLQGFCHAAWDGIQAKQRSRAAAARKLDQWLEKARRYGYETE